jgi:hypothetical protein
MLKIITIVYILLGILTVAVITIGIVFYLKSKTDVIVTSSVPITSNIPITKKPVITSSPLPVILPINEESYWKVKNYIGNSIGPSYFDFDNNVLTLKLSGKIIANSDTKKMNMLYIEPQRVVNANIFLSFIPKNDDRFQINEGKLEITDSVFNDQSLYKAEKIDQIIIEKLYFKVSYINRLGFTNVYKIQGVLIDN